MNKSVFLLVAPLLLAALAWAHETRTIGEVESSYDIVVGFTTEPAYTDERNGLDLRVRESGNGEAVQNLQNSLTAQLIAPDGEATLDLEIRARHGEPGSYTDDFVLTEPGVYTVRLTGFIGDVEVDESFDLHEVRSFDELLFPQ